MSKTQDSGSSAKHEPSDEASDSGAQDEDGIANFLTEAIGNAGAEFMQIGDSDTFAELMEVVTSSLIAKSCSSSRRNSTQDNDTLNVAGALENPSFENVTTTLIKEEDAQSHRKRKKLKKKEKSFESPSPSSAEPNLNKTSQTIQNRLKIRLKLGSVKDTSPSKKTPSPVKVKSPKVAKIVQSPKVGRKDSSPLPTNKRQSNIVLHQKCLKEFQTVSEQFDVQLSPCCVIMYDILKTEKFFQMAKASTKIPNSSSTSINLCTISERKINEFHKIEQKNRQYYVEYLNSSNKPTKSKTIHDIATSKNNSITETEKTTPKKPAKTSEKLKELSKEGTCKNLEKEFAQKDQEKKKHNTPEKSKAVELHNNDKKHLEKFKSENILREKSPQKKLDGNTFNTEHRGVVNEKHASVEAHKTEKIVKKSLEKKTSEIEENTKLTTTGIVPEKDKERLQQPKPKSPNKDYNNTIAKNELNRIRTGTEEKTDGRRIDAQGRREIDRSQREKDKKFENFERERSQKYSGLPKEDRSKITTSKILLDSFSPVKALPQSFRIPKAHAEVSRTCNQLEVAKHDLPNHTREIFEAEKETRVLEPVNKSDSTPHHHKDIKVPHTSPNKTTDKPTNSQPKQEQVEIKKIAPQAELKIEVSNEKELKEVVQNAEQEEEASAPSDDGKTISPVSQVQMGSFSLAVTKLFCDKSNIKIPTLEHFSNISDSTTEKCAWWFAKCDQEPSEDFLLPMLESSLSSDLSDTGSNVSFLGNVSNPDSPVDKDCQVHEISSTGQRYDAGTEADPDKVDEFCGRSLLQAKIRTSSGNFRNIFDLRAGALYEKENFQAKCNLCNQLIVGKRDLAKHVRGTNHKNNLRKIDPEMDQLSNTSDSPTKKSSVINEKKAKESKNVKIKEEKSSPNKTGPEESANKNKFKSISVTSNGLSVVIPAECEPQKRQRPGSPISPRMVTSHNKRGRLRSRSRSRENRKRRSRSRSKTPVRIPRSPGAPSRILRSPRKSRKSRSPERSKRHSRHSRSRSRSPKRSSRRRRSSSERRGHRRSQSPDRSHSRRRRRSKTPNAPLPKKDNKEFHEKLALTAEGLWSDELEKRFKLMEAEVAMFREQYIDKTANFVAVPESHPKYANEWTEFWERRYQEVEKEGKDPDTYNYVSEWKDFWSKRLNLLIQDESDEQTLKIKKKYGMDFESLNNLRKPISAPGINLEQSNHLEQINQSTKAQNPILLTLDSNSSRGGSVLNISSGLSIGSVDMIIQGDTTKVEVGKPQVSIEDFKSKWEALTRPKQMTDGLSLANRNRTQDTPFGNEFNATASFSQQLSTAISESTSTSDESFDFQGFDLVQVLRLMCNTEDQLSFLAPKVIEYYKIAEELELKKSKGSQILLNNEELVTVLFQARDRFMTMIRSNILSRDILKALNLTVYSLTCILDAPQCQKFRPRVPLATHDVDSESYIKTGNSVTPEPVPASKIEQNTDSVVIRSEEVSALVTNLSSKQKVAIASEITKYLLLVGGQSMSNSELTQFVLKLISPIIIKPQETKATNNVGGETKKVESHSNDPLEQKPPIMLGHDYTHSFDMRISGVSSSKVVGSALPTLPNTFRAGSPPDRPAEPSAQDTRDRRDYDTFEGSSRSQQQQPQPRSSNGDGRRSPFSRRELAMNPGRGCRY